MESVVADGLVETKLLAIKTLTNSHGRQGTLSTASSDIDGALRCWGSKSYDKIMGGGDKPKGGAWALRAPLWLRACLSVWLTTFQVC